jgi:hypothetical protein
VRYFGKAAPQGTHVKLRAETPSPLRSVPGEFTYVGRDVDALVDGDGRFRLSAVDCGACAPDKFAPRYTLLVEPPSESNIPWLVRTAFEVSGDRSLRNLSLEVPRIRKAKVRTVEDEVPDSAPGLKARVFLPVDAKGQVIPNPDVAQCERVEQGTQLCAKGAVQIGEGRVGADGTLVLSLPQHVEPFPLD